MKRVHVFDFEIKRCFCRKEGVQGKLVTPQEIREMAPFLKTDDLEVSFQTAGPHDSRAERHWVRRVCEPHSKFQKSSLRRCYPGWTIGTTAVPCGWHVTFLKAVCTFALQGGVWLPDDGVVNPTDVAMALSRKAKEMGEFGIDRNKTEYLVLNSVIRVLIFDEIVAGVRFFEDCEVQRVLTKNNQVRGVVTAERMVGCKYFVNCAGMVRRNSILGDPLLQLKCFSRLRNLKTSSHCV